MEEYVAYLERIWQNKWLTNRGELIRELEAKLQTHLKINNLLIVNNGTIALQIAIKALDLSGDIITTPFSYVATTSSIVWEGCNPVFVDIDPKYLTIDETKIESAITEKTKGILATHVYGNPCNVGVIQRIAEKFDIKIIYDAAHCFGVKYKGKSILNWGDISTLSLHATKLYHTGEGGAIICNNEELAHKIFYLHNFGHNGPEDFFGLGVNGKISELNAAMGLACFPYIDKILFKRHTISDIYDTLLCKLNLRKPSFREEAESNYIYYPVIFDSEKDLLRVKEELSKNQIFSRRYFYPSLNNLPYLERQETPISEEISKKVLCLPLYAELEEKDVRRICKVIENCL